MSPISLSTEFISHRTKSVKTLIGSNLGIYRTEQNEDISKSVPVILRESARPSWRGRAPFPQSRMPASIEEFNKAKCMYVPVILP
jgi:hypothetical protein